MTTGKLVKEYRKKSGLTQGELAEKCGISRSYLGDVEGDRYNPSVETLKKIADALNVGVSALIDNGRASEDMRERFSLDGLHILTDAGASISEDALEDIIRYIKFRQQENDR